LPFNVEVLEDFNHPDLKFSASGHTMELDIFIPSLNLAFEFNGYHHYHALQFYGESSSYKHRDEEKHQTSKLHGITLIEVPYWWQRDKTTIKSLLKTYRPDILWD